MGDFCTPKKKDLCDKLRRRFTNYRQHHSSAENRYLTGRTGIYEQQKQETQQLRQRWLDSRAKKTAKQSKANRDNNNSQNEHRSNLIVTKLKKKIDGVGPDVTSSTTSNATAETVFNFNDQNGSGATGTQSSNSSNNNSNNNNNNNSSGGFQGGAGGGIPSVSVQIVQQISAHSQQESSQTIHTNVTVSSRYGNSDSPDIGGASHSVHTSVQCKQEPPEDVSSSRGTNTAAPNSGLATSSTTTSTASSGIPDPPDLASVGLGINNVDDIQNFFDSLEKRGADIEPALLKELNEFDEIVKKKCHRDSSSNESAASNMYGPLACGSPGGGFPHNIPPGSMGSMFDGTATNMNPNATTGMTNHNHNHSHTIPVPTAIPEPTGPAAETLKQMAAQHQHQQHNPTVGYPMKHVDQFSDNLRNGFPTSYPQPYRSVANSNSPFPPFNQQANHLADTSQMNPDMASPHAYGATKPLTHYSTEHGSNQTPPSSSLQQLQNQIQSHFKPSSAAASPHQMQITQTQQMQVSHGPHSLQMTQTQQVQMQPSPQSISLSQQQNFSMGQQQQMVSDQMKMQMMEKMRMEQQQQQQQQQQAVAQQGRMPPQYMGRPPPEYKMHPNARPQNSYPTVGTATNPNPLQTMQNMVNQTSTYGVVKSEVPTGVTAGQGGPGMMQQTTQMSAMQQQSIAVSGAAASHVSNYPPSTRPGFHHQQSQPQQQQSVSQLQQQQHLQQQPQQQPPPPAYSSVETASVSSRTQQSSTNNYTSAIMRNQRPPNVNVGPEGLNITQPRTHSEWANNTMMGTVGMIGMRPQMGNGGTAGPHTHSMTQQTSSMSAHMMQFQHRPPHYGHNSATMAQRQQQQQQQQQIHAPMGGQARAGSASMMPNSSQMMMQHQSMQVNQQITMRSSSAGYAMGGPSPAGGSMQITQQPGLNAQAQAANGTHQTGYSPTTTSVPNTEELLNFLDNPPMFDSIQNSTSDDLSLFDDLLNGK